MSELHPAEKLVGAHRQTALKELHGWAEVLERDAIRKTYHFADFSSAFAFMTRVALMAEKWDHHPEWFNSGARVEIILSSHDVDGLSQRDVDMAHRIDQLAPDHDK